MVSLSPDTQSSDYTHMYNFQDLNKNIDFQQEHNGTIFDFIKTHDMFSRFSKIVIKSGLRGVLDDPQGNFTLFLPPDKFLSSLTDYFIDYKMDVGFAKSIVNSFLIKKRLDKSHLTRLPISKISTSNPFTKLTFLNVRNKTVINAMINVLKFDIHLKNGVIHIVDDYIYQEM